MMNVLSMIVAMISQHRSPTEAKEWFDTVIEKCYDVADKILANKELFMMNVLSMIVAMISQHRSPREAKEWFNTIIKEVRKLKKNHKGIEAKFWFILILNIYEMKKINSYLWLKFAILNGLEEIEKHYEDFPKDTLVDIVNVCKDLIKTGKKIKDPDIEDVERLLSRLPSHR